MWLIRTYNLAVTYIRLHLLYLILACTFQVNIGGLSQILLLLLLRNIVKSWIRLPSIGRRTSRETHLSVQYFITNSLRPVHYIIVTHFVISRRPFWKTYKATLLLRISIRFLRSNVESNGFELQANTQKKKHSVGAKNKIRQFPKHLLTNRRYKTKNNNSYITVNINFGWHVQDRQTKSQMKWKRKHSGFYKYNAYIKFIILLKQEELVGKCSVFIFIKHDCDSHLCIYNGRNVQPQRIPRQSIQL